MKDLPVVLYVRTDYPIAIVVLGQFINRGGSAHPERDILEKIRVGTEAGTSVFGEWREKVIMVSHERATEFEIVSSNIPYCVVISLKTLLCVELHRLASEPSLNYSCSAGTPRNVFAFTFPGPGIH